MRTDTPQPAPIHDWETAARALVVPDEWTVHRLRPGHPVGDGTTTVDLGAIAREDTPGRIQVVLANLLPDRTARAFLAHPRTTDSPSEGVGDALQVVSYDPDFAADLAASDGGKSRPSAEGSARLVAAESPLGCEGHGPLSLVPVLRRLVTTDRPTTLRVCLDLESANTGNGLRSTIWNVFGKTDPGGDRVGTAGCRAVTVAPEPTVLDATRALEGVLGEIAPSATPTAADPTTQVSTDGVGDPGDLPVFDLGSATDWHRHDLRGTTSSREAVPTSVADRFEALEGLPLGSPIDHGGRAGPAAFTVPVTGRTTVARYTVNYADSAGFRSDYVACQSRSGPTVVLDGVGVCSDAVAATHESACEGDLTPIMGLAPARLTEGEYRSLLTHREDTFLVDPSRCTDPKAVGTRLLTALNDVGSNLPDHGLSVLIDAPLACTTYEPFRRLLESDHGVTTVLRIPIPHRQCVFGPPSAGEVRRAWYRLLSRNATVTLLSRLPTTTSEDTVAALTPPTGDPGAVRGTATRLGTDHWLASVRSDAFERPAAGGGDRQADVDSRRIEDPMTIPVHSPAAPAGCADLAAGRRRSLTQRLTRHRRRGIRPEVPSPGGMKLEAIGSLATGPDPGRAGEGAADVVPTDDDEASADQDGADRRPPRGHVPKTTIPYTDRFPDPVRYDAATHIVACRRCGNRYGATIEGVERAIECCYDIDRVDRDAIPAVDAQVKLTDEERRALAYSDEQLVFLKLVNDAMLRRFDPDLEYDIVEDSMTLLRDYAGVDRDGVQQLIADGLVRDDGRYPHQLYTITHEGRDLINEGRRHGVDVGEGLGDLSESSEHVMLVELLRRYVDQEYVGDPDCPVTEVRPYYELGDHRFDVAALDDDGEVIIVGEAERPTNDVHEAVPADYDKMAAQDPEEAIWVVPSHDAGHTAVLNPLTNPSGDGPRINDEFSQSSRMQDLAFDHPGLTQLHTVHMLQSQVAT